MKPDGQLIPFGSWAPDVTPLGTQATPVATNVIPKADGYGPFKDLQDFTQALPANCRGFFFARKSDGSIAVFAGTATNLYLLNNTTFAWANVSKGGGPYGSLVSTDNWRFDQFNNLVIAVQVNTVPQKYDLSGGGPFADLGGSPPSAAHIAIVNRFVMLTGLLSNPRRVQWSDLDAPETWTAGVGLSDFQDLPDGGASHQVSGGDAYGVVFQDQSIRTLTYAPGSAVVFQINRISTQDTLYAQYSVINAGTKTFFCSAQGFKVIESGGLPQPIGKNFVDKFFFDSVDTGNLQLVIGATDPTATRVYWAYKSQQGLAGLFDRILCYDWSFQTPRWSLLEVSGQYLAALAKPGLTLEQLDAIASGALTVLGTANNGSGAIRLHLNALSNGPFNIVGQNFIEVYGVGGTVEANGSWHFTVIDATHIDLTGSAFVNAWTSGGAIGGALDSLPFSLDSISVAAIAQLAAFTPLSTLGFFAGANLEATIETPEVDNQGIIAKTQGFRPFTDCPTAMGSIGYRMTAQATVVYTSETVVNSDGISPQRRTARYQRARLRLPAGTTWSYARGISPIGGAAGKR